MNLHEQLGQELHITTAARSIYHPNNNGADIAADNTVVNFVHLGFELGEARFAFFPELVKAGLFFLNDCFDALAFPGSFRFDACEFFFTLVQLLLLLIFLGEEGDDGSWEHSELRVASRTGGRLGRFILGFGQDEDGEVYVLTTENVGPFGTTGRVYRIVPAP